MLRNGAVLLLVLLISGCYSWQRVSEETAHIDAEKYELLAPVGWVQIQVNDHLLITKDGPDLQKIQISFYGHDKVFEELEKKSSADMLPAELADLYVAKLKKQHENGLPSLQVMSNRPVTINGVAGFELVMSYNSQNGLVYKHSVTGFATQQGFYAVNYLAPELHYYPIDIAAYEALLKSFKTKA